MADPVLVVAEADGYAPDSLRNPSVCLTFCFEPTLDGAQRREASGDSAGLDQSWRVPSRWQPLAADFRQQILNLPFADLLMRVRPGLVRVEALAGCTLDLPRMAALWQIPVTVVLPPVDRLPPPPSRAADWLRSALAAATTLEFPPQGGEPDAYRPFTQAPIHAFRQAPQAASGHRTSHRFDYALYEFGTRDHPLLWQMQESYVGFFSACSDVLDLGCGAGVFLGLLEQAGIPAVGVERNPTIAAYARGLGFDVTEADALEFLEWPASLYDGIYCSHFVEHLPTDQVHRLLGRMFRALRPGGRAVLVFPDPESIRSQLLGFWRDPEHVRFYHPDLVELMARAEGFECIWHSHRDGPDTREVVPFPAQPMTATAEWPQPFLGGPPVRHASPEPTRRWDRWLARLGLASAARLHGLEQRLAEAERALQQVSAGLEQTQPALAALSADTRRLWQVNQTWSWQDNAVLVLRRPGPPAASRAS